MSNSYETFPHISGETAEEAEQAGESPTNGPAPQDREPIDHHAGSL